ncbi:glycerol-3-phosphate 1-O-acyltransferase PlsY [Planctomycetota bacterium]
MLDVALILLCYLLGAIPFGLMFGLWVRGVDIRKYGSGNLGATNAGRVLGKKTGFFILFLDILKGFAPIFTLNLLSEHILTGHISMSESNLLVLCAAAAILGHMFPVYLKFKGGKGVATGIGVILAFEAVPGFCAIIIFILVLAVTRYVSLGSIAGVMTVPVVSFMVYAEPLDAALPITIFNLLIAIFVIVKHRDNIVRLLQGKEAKVTTPVIKDASLEPSEGDNQ